MENDKPLVAVGDRISLVLNRTNELGNRVETEIIKVKQSKKRKHGTCWKYHLLLPDSTTISTRLLHLKWDIAPPKSKKTRVTEGDNIALLSVRNVPRPMVKSRATITFPLSCLRYILAPMVGASELAFRLLCRRYGATLAYTPMINSDRFAHDPQYRSEEFQSTISDKPVVAHFSANDPQTFLAAAKLVEDHCDAIDLNLGCPQRVAYVGHFGSFLLDEVDRPLVLNLVRIIADNCLVPIFVKIRLLDELNDTIKLCQQLVEAGASLIAIHGRYRVNLVNRTGPGARDGPAHLDQIKAIREVVTTIPIISNGNVRCWNDVIHNMELTGSAGIMSAEGILDNPALFYGGLAIDCLQLALEYLDLVATYPIKLKSVVFHIRRMCKDILMKYQMMDDCVNASSVDAVRLIIQNIVHFERTGTFVQDPNKAKLEKEALERRKREEGKRKDFEARMIRKAKREGKAPDYYLSLGAAIPTFDEVKELKSMQKEEAFSIWKEKFGQHCWAFHFESSGCIRDRTCSFLHTDVKVHNDLEAYG